MHDQRADLLPDARCHPWHPDVSPYGSRPLPAAQLAIATVLVLREGPTPLSRQLRLLCWATQSVGAAVLALALLSRRHQSCARLRPYLLVAARLLFDVLCPQVVWQMASSSNNPGGTDGKDEAATWTGMGCWLASLGWHSWRWTVTLARPPSCKRPVRGPRPQGMRFRSMTSHCPGVRPSMQACSLSG